jgi:precorrin-3B synthase
MTLSPSAPNRRGWCPGVRRPMATGDGLLVRVHPPCGVLASDQARLLAALAHECGNGYLDVTARGNLQIRGSSEATYPGLAARLDAAGLVEPEGDGPHRLTLVSPLAGRDLAERFDARALATAVEMEARALPGLPPKAAVVVDGGGTISLYEVTADLHLTAVEDAAASGIALGLATPAGPHWIGTTTPEHAPAAVGAILARYGKARRSGSTAARRIRDLDSGTLAHLTAAAELDPVAVPVQGRPTVRAGVIRLDDRECALMAALPFGRCSAADLDRAASWSERFGCGEVRLSFTRGLLLPGIATTDIAKLLDEVRRAGLIVDPDDPRLQVIACAGAPACSSASAPTQEHAAALSEALRPLLARGATVHVSGCAKGCAHPGRADLTLVGGNPVYAVVPGGAPADPAPIQLSLDEIMKRLATIDSPLDLADALAERA